MNQNLNPQEHPMTRSEITWYCIYLCSNWSRMWIRIWIHKNSPYLALTGELWGVFVRILEKIDALFGTALYFFMTCKNVGIISLCVIHAYSCFMSSCSMTPFDFIWQRYGHFTYSGAILQKFVREIRQSTKNTWQNQMKPNQIYKPNGTDWRIYAWLN